MRRAGAFRGDHAGAHRRIGRTCGSEQLALARRLDAAQNGAAFAARVVAAGDLLEIEAALGIEGRISRLQTQAAIRRGSESAPFEALAQFENLGDRGFGDRVSVALDGADILVLDLVAAFIDLADARGIRISASSAIAACPSYV